VENKEHLQGGKESVRKRRKGMLETRNTKAMIKILSTGSKAEKKSASRKLYRNYTHRNL
jgi:hypothetical protein